MGQSGTNDSTGRQPAGLLHYREDRRSVVFLALSLGLLVFPLASTPPQVFTLPWLVLATLFCFNACIINHNHIHHPTFRHRGLDELFGHLLGLAKGHTSTGVVVAHNLNHHLHHGGKDDWIRASLAGGGPGAVRLLRYVALASVAMARGRNAADAPKLPPWRERRLGRERMSLWAFMGLILWLDWETALLFVFLPWGLAMAMLTGVNLLQHDGCHPEEPMRCSRNFTGRLGNWFFLNNGFHTAHHLRPNLHWSRLPRLHREESDRIPSWLNRRSILAYLFTRYLFATRTPAP